MLGRLDAEADFVNPISSSVNIASSARSICWFFKIEVSFIDAAPALKLIRPSVRTSDADVLALARGDRDIASWKEPLRGGSPGCEAAIVVGI